MKDNNSSIFWAARKVEKQSRVNSINIGLIICILFGKRPMDKTVYDYLKQSTVKIWPGQFAVVKSKVLKPNCFASIVDRNEITLIQKEEDIDPGTALKMEKGWRILTFDTVLPFELTGFLAAVSTALAVDQIPIFVISAYSTDHFLIKNENLPQTLNVLRKIGVEKIEYL